MCKCKHQLHLAVKDVFIVKQADTMDATATAADILEGTTAYAKNTKLDGAMPDNTPEAIMLNEKDDVYAIPTGYHDGTGTVALDDTEKAKLIPSNILEDVTLFGVTGVVPSTYDATAVAEHVLTGETFYKNGGKMYGTMPDNGSVTLSLSQRDAVVPIASGYHDGNGYVKIADAEVAKIIPENILKDVEILGVIGTVVRQTNDRLANYINGTLQNIDLSGDEIGDIRDYMFYNNTMLVSIVLPNDVTQIGAYSFSGCSGLTSVTLPESLRTLSTASFIDCIRLESIDLPRGLETIGSSAFKNTRLEKLWIPDTVEYINAPGRANSPFYDCYTLTDIYCETEYQPAGFSTYWNFTGSTTRATVHWGVSREEFDAL